MPTQEDFLNALKAVCKKASADSEFRKLCLENAAAAIKEISGLEIAKDVKIRFAEQLEEQVFVLPPLGEEELSDQDLEQLAGGYSGLGVCPSWGGGFGGFGC